MPASPLTARFTRRQILVHMLSATFVLLALAGGAFLGSLVNRAPARAETTPMPTAASCVVLCDSATGSGTVGTPGSPGLQVGGQGGAVNGSGGVGAMPVGQ